MVLLKNYIDAPCSSEMTEWVHPGKKGGGGLGSSGVDTAIRLMKTITQHQYDINDRQKQRGEEGEKQELQQHANWRTHQRGCLCVIIDLNRSVQRQRK